MGYGDYGWMVRPKAQTVGNFYQRAFVVRRTIPIETHTWNAVDIMPSARHIYISKNYRQLN